MGETIDTGRNIIWRNVTSDIFHNIWDSHLGEDVSTVGMAYYGEGLGSHNVFLDISWKYTIIASVLFFIIIFLIINRLYRDLSGQAQKCMLITWFAILLHMTFESSLFVGAIDYTMCLIMPLLLLKLQGKEEALESSNTGGNKDE